MKAATDKRQWILEVPTGQAETRARQGPKITQEISRKSWARETRGLPKARTGLSAGRYEQGGPEEVACVNPSRAAEYSASRTQAV